MKNENFVCAESSERSCERMKKKSSFLRNIFFFKQWVINFWERKCGFLKYFLKFQFI